MEKIWELIVVHFKAKNMDAVQKLRSLTGSRVMQFFKNLCRSYLTEINRLNRPEPMADIRAATTPGLSPSE